jgi:hypothetical protein
MLQIDLSVHLTLYVLYNFNFFQFSIIYHVDIRLKSENVFKALHRLTFLIICEVVGKVVDLGAGTRPRC